MLWEHLAAGTSARVLSANREHIRRLAPGGGVNNRSRPLRLCYMIRFERLPKQRMSPPGDRSI